MIAESDNQFGRVTVADSGSQREHAHRFYFANGFHINCYHFAQRLS